MDQAATNMHGLNSLSEWLLNNDHQCTAGDSPCWCVEQRDNHRQRSDSSITLEQNEREAEQNEHNASDIGQDFTRVTSETAEQPSLAGESRKRVSESGPQDTLPPKPKRQYIRKPKADQHRGATIQAKQLLSQNATLPASVCTRAGPPTLLSLPAEIRSSIYSYVLPSKIYHWYWHSRDLLQQHKSWTSFLINFEYPTELLYTCKTIYQEAKAAMYSRLVIVCDLRPDRFAGFNFAIPRPKPEPSLITKLVLNLQLDVLYTKYGHHFVDPLKARYSQLRQLKSIKTLSLRVCFERKVWTPHNQAWYNSLTKAHLMYMVAALPDSVVIKGMAAWDPPLGLTDMCCSMEMELRERAAAKEWVDLMVTEVRRELTLLKSVKVHR